jgi:uncharacterized protein YchJ
MNVDGLYDEFSRMRSSTRGTIAYDGKKLRPNQACPCGSKKKYKKCCQQKLEETARARGSNSINEDELKTN